MSACGVFVTGTDTEIGKTVVSLSIMNAMASRGLRVAGMKPVATGCERRRDGWRNPDAEALRAAADIRCSYASVNPYAFGPPIAPHLAASAAAVEIDLDRIRASFEALSGSADCVVVEGIGGWAVPLSAQTTVADLARKLDLPVLLVVGLRLGCINHALLSGAAIRAAGADLGGWIGNQVDPLMELVEDNVASIAARIGAPCLGVVPYSRNASPARLAGHLDAPALYRLMGLEGGSN